MFKKTTKNRALYKEKECSVHYEWQKLNLLMTFKCCEQTS